jgi:hypothetical protein
MTPEQVTQLALILIAAILVIPSFITLGGLVYLSTRVVPAQLKQSQQLSDNNKELTTIAKQNAAQIASVEETLNKIKPALEEQTAAFEGAIDKQTNEYKAQGFDFKSYQSLLNDSMSLHTNAIEVNANKTEANTASISALKSAFETFANQFPQLLKDALIKDQFQHDALLSEFRLLRSDFSRAVFQQQARITSTIPAVTIPSPAAPLPAKPPDESKL